MMIIVLPIVLLTGYFTGGSVPAVISYAPELCGIAASAYVVLHVARNGFARIRIAYWILIVLIALHLLFGIIAKHVQPGTVIIGGRLYLRTIPFFLLAIALIPDQQELKEHFYIVLGIALIQLPVAIYQKVSNYNRALKEGYITTTGDWVVGTLGNIELLVCLSNRLLCRHSRALCP